MSEADVRNWRQQASIHRKQGQFAAALVLYEKMWHQHQVLCNAWDGWGYAHCLYKLQRYEAALKAATEARALDPDLGVLKGLQAWCLYYLSIKPEPPSADFDDALVQIVALCDPQDRYSPLTRTVFRAVDVAVSKPQEQLRLLGFLDAAQLSREGFQVQEGNKTRTLPSDWVRYWGKWTEALFRLQDYVACVERCEALLADGTLDRTLQIWFQRRLARCYFALQQTDQALALYTQILQVKKDWFLYKELAEVYRQAGNAEQALHWAKVAVQAPGELPKKIHVYLLLAELVLASHPPLAHQYYTLAAKIRQEQGWSIPESLQGYLGPTTPGSAVLLRRLRAHWQPVYEQGEPQERLRGQILNLLPHGKAGFIRPEGGTKNIYFETRGFRGDESELQPGVHVSFILKEGFDHKKQKPSQKAVKLRRCRSQREPQA